MSKRLYTPPAALIASGSIPAGTNVRAATIARAGESAEDLAACVLFTTEPTDRALAGWRGWTAPMERGGATTPPRENTIAIRRVNANAR